MKSEFKHGLSGVICLVAVLACSFASSALAATYYWDNNGSTAGFGTAGGTWAVSTSGNATQGWSTSSGGTTLPTTTTTTSADILSFGTSSLALGAGAITVSGAPEANQLTFGSASGAITFSGGAGISLGGASPAISAQNNNNIISTPIIFAPSSGGNSIAFSLPTSLAGTLTLNGGISGAGGVIFTTPNVASANWLQKIVLGATCNYSGDTTITAGSIHNSTMLQCGVVNALPPATVLTIDGGNGTGTGRTCHFDLNGLNQTLAGLSSVSGLSLRSQRVVNTSATSATLTLTENSTRTFSGIIGWVGTVPGSGGVATTPNLNLVMSGSGNCILTGNNQYTGDTTINSGTLHLSGTGTLGGGNYAGSITNHGTFNCASSGAQTLSGVLIGSGALNCSGSGTLTLTGTNRLPTNLVSSGTFAVSGSGLVTGAVTVISGGTLSLTNGGSAKAVTVNAGGTISVPDFGTATNLTCAGGSTLSFNFSATNTVGQLNVAAASGITNSGAANSVTINLTGVVPTDGIYTLINYTGSLRGSGFGAYALGAVSSGKNYTLTNTGSAVRVIVATAPALVSVETRADGTGVVVPDTTVITGAALTNFAILRSSTGAFITNLPATWSLTSLSGAVVASNLVAAPDNRSAVYQPTGVGSARILATVSGTNSVPSGLITSINATAVRPFIWVRDSEKVGILEKIATNAWATSLYNQLLARPVAALASHQSNRDAYLRGLPVNWTAVPPRFTTSSPPYSGVGEGYFNTALDCAILYYLTGDTNYAQLAADILQNAVASYQSLVPSSNTGNGGWLIPSDLLYEARQMGCQLPIVYDFIYAYLQTNQVYDVATAGLTNFSFTNAQYVFRTYYQLVRDRGQKGNNWSALMATCMLNSLLAFDSLSERTNALQVYLTTGGPKQASLEYDYRNYSNPGNIWPESLGYASAVVGIRSTHMVLIERYDPTIDLFGVYTNLPTSLPRIHYLRYPNDNMQICFGDGSRNYGGQPFFRYELVYQHALARGRTNLTALFGSLINGGIATGVYNRSTLNAYGRIGYHEEPLELLWQAPTIAESPVTPDVPRTDAVTWAGISLQRNPSSVNNVTYGLMAFVGGANHCHAHASGMNMELYGLGEVLGAKPGYTTYGSTIHENYYRLYSAANTIIVNAASQGSGGWSGLAMSTVQSVAMEPQPFAAAVSPNFSFTCSSFADNVGANAEATQQRTVAILRTSPTNGFYVDFFRSKSTVTNRVATNLSGNVTNQFHDYIYHNVGSTNVSLTTNGVTLPLVSQPNRFQNDIGDSYKQPGWRYFSNTVVSYMHNQPVRAQFVATRSNTPLYMDAVFPAVANREYARVSSPPIVDFNSTADSPAIVVRQIGDAWDKPFAVVYEPHFNPSGATVTNVTTLLRTNVVVGLKIESFVSGKAMVHYVFSNPNATESYTNAAIGLTFKGRFGIVADNGDGSTALYLGQGSSLSYRGNSVAVVGGANSQVEVQFRPGQSPLISANAPVNVVSAAAPVFAQISRGGDGVVTFTATGALGVPYTLWGCTNLTSGAWMALTNSSVTSSPFVIQDAEASGLPARYYRFSTP